MFYGFLTIVKLCPIMEFVKPQWQSKLLHLPFFEALLYCHNISTYLILDQVLWEDAVRVLLLNFENFELKNNDVDVCTSI